MAINTFLLKINTVEIPKMAKFAVGRNKLWTDAGRNMAGELRSTFLGVYPKLEVGFTYMTEAEITSIIALLDEPSFTCEWYDFRTKTHKSGLYYASDFTIPVFDKKRGLFEPFTVNLIPFKKMT